MIDKRIAAAVEKGDISQDAADVLSQALKQVQDSLDQAEQSGGISPFSPSDISQMFSSLKQSLAVAREPAAAPASHGVDITV